MFYRLDQISDLNFEEIALKVFHYQYDTVEIYQKFCDGISKTSSTVHSLIDIPFIPIQFFKSHCVASSNHSVYFESSGTGNQQLSRHYIKDIKIYRQSLDASILHFFHDFENYELFGLLPHYLERPNSSLVYMVSYWLEKLNQAKSRFYLHDLDLLKSEIISNLEANKPVLLIGISFALLDLAKIYQTTSEKLFIIETGGMKGRGEEMPKNELIATLKTSFPNAKIISEYGMCELLSQAYSDESLDFHCPPWMRMLVSDLNDPLTNSFEGNGLAKVIDLANYNSCSFVETQDLISLNQNKSFKILGRKDHSDVRGCSLMY